MQDIEFETLLRDRMIQLPLPYQHWHEGQPVKVIVLVADNNDKPTGRNINRHAGKINLAQDPLAFQDAMRDEWA